MGRSFFYPNQTRWAADDKRSLCGWGMEDF